MAGAEIFKPKQIILGRGQIRRADLYDGSVDLRSANSGQNTTWMSADSGNDARLPNAVLFQCECGHWRRVVLDSEPNFTCERPFENPRERCPFIWSVKREVEGYNEDGTKRAVLSRDDKGLPIITGRKLKEVVEEEIARRVTAGEVTYAQPQFQGKQAQADLAAQVKQVKK